MNKYREFAAELRRVSDGFKFISCDYGKKAADMIEELYSMYLKSEIDATNLTGELVHVYAKLKENEYA